MAEAMLTVIYGLGVVLLMGGFPFGLCLAIFLQCLDRDEFPPLMLLSLLMASFLLVAAPFMPYFYGVPAPVAVAISVVGWSVVVFWYSKWRGQR